MIKIIIETLIFIIITLLIVSAFNKYDTEVNLAFTKKDVILISITSFFSSLIITSKYENIGSENTVVILITLITLIMSYTDLKTMQVYTILDMIAILISGIYTICNIDKVNSFINIYPNSIVIIVSIIILAVLIMSQGIGHGDSMLYISMLLFYITRTEHGSLLFMVNLLISNLLFLIVNSTKFIKNKKQKLPLVPYILLAWLFTC